MRKRSLDMVHTLARRDERVVFIGSDLSPNLLGEMKKEFSQRYYMEGIAEANIIGMAAGMAMDGFMPYVNTIATFITRRCYEQVAVDLCSARPAGAVDRQWRRATSMRRWDRPIRRSRTSPSCGHCRI